MLLFNFREKLMKVSVKRDLHNISKALKRNMKKMCTQPFLSGKHEGSLGMNGLIIRDACTIWYHLYNLKNVKNTHEGVILLIKLQALPCNFTTSITPPWVFFTFLKFFKWYQIAESVSFENSDMNMSDTLSVNKLLWRRFTVLMSENAYLFMWAEN